MKVLKNRELFEEFQHIGRQLIFKAHLLANDIQTDRDELNNWYKDMTQMSQDLLVLRDKVVKYIKEIN